LKRVVIRLVAPAQARWPRNAVGSLPLTAPPRRVWPGTVSGIGSRDGLCGDGAAGIWLIN